MLNFYGRKYPRKTKNDQLKELYDFKFFLDKSKIKTFKTEVFRILNTYSFYIDTKEINFKNWFLSLSQFFLYIRPIPFSLKKTIVKFNMILFLATNTDELKTVNKVRYRSWVDSKSKPLKSHQLKYLVKIHPFIRNIHHDEIFS